LHFLRNALDHVPRKVDDDCLQELRWIYDRRDLAEVRRDIAQWLSKWQSKYSRLCDWVEENIEETAELFPAAARASQAHEVDQHARAAEPRAKRRTHVVRIFPNAESCLRLIRALAVEIHENWLEGTRYLNMDHLIEHQKEALRRAA
jgi:putative transposase